jgi:antitoxin HigA-1
VRAKKLAPIHPGETLQELFMEPLGLSQHELAKALGISVSTVNRIVRGKCSITADTAMRLGRYFRTTAQVWLNMQVRYDLEVARDRNEAEIRKTVKPRPKTDRLAVPA